MIIGLLALLSLVFPLFEKQMEEESGKVGNVPYILGVLALYHSKKRMNVGCMQRNVM